VNGARFAVPELRGAGLRGAVLEGALVP